MKLKRILSLALSGVLAVSMLTACGGFGGGGGVQDYSRVFRDTLNNQLDTEAVGQAHVNFDGNGELASAVRTVVRGMTQSDLSGLSLDGMTGAVVQDGSEIQKMMARYIDYNGPWFQLAGGTYTTSSTDPDELVRVGMVLYNGALSVEGVANDMADKIADMDLERLIMDEDPDFTFETHAVAYKVTIPGETGKDSETPASDTTVWVVGLMVEQSKVQD